MTAAGKALDALEAASREAMRNPHGIASSVYLPGNLAAPLAAVARAAMAYRDEMIHGLTIEGLAKSKQSLFAALDALEAAAEGVAS